LAAIPSQLANPGSQALSTQPPIKQAPVEWDNEHALRHAPQFETSLRRSASQPLTGFPSQSWKPIRHEVTQLPSVHPGNAFGRAAHRVPHAPQFETDVLVSVSHPFDGLVSQSAYPSAHRAIEQRPAEHMADALGGMQATRQPPQWATSVAVFTSQPLAASPSQSAYPARHS